MLIDLHAHSSGISCCCRISFEEVLKQALLRGVDGIVLTNHYQKSYILDNKVTDFVNKYISEFYAAEQYGKKIGCKVFFGVELTMENYTNVHMLIYGVEPEFLLKYPTLFDCTQEELYSIVKANNGILVQAHPFRNNTTVLNVEFLDGVEINCHPLYQKSYSSELSEIALKNKLILTCGGDYHGDTYRAKCGMILPDDIKSSADLRLFLLSDKEKILCVQEPNTDDYIWLNPKKQDR